VVPGSSPGGPTYKNQPDKFRAIFLLSFNLSLTLLAIIFATQDYIMKKVAFVLIALISLTSASAQLKQKKDWSKVAIDRAGDHFMLQLSSDNWGGAPDSIKNRMKGLSRGFNFYLMMNKPFKSDPRWSVAFGLGVGNSNIYFKKTNIGITSAGTRLPFTNLDSTNSFKKYKLATTFLEVPIELRHTFDPENEGKSWKFALGVKVGTMLNAHTKGKTLVNKNGATLNAYTEKESKKSFFNTTRLSATARVGIGHFSLFGAYSITSFLKDGAGPSLHPYQIGLSISGL
jgi:hypothetical protein